MHRLFHKYSLIAAAAIVSVLALGSFVYRAYVEGPSVPEGKQYTIGILVRGSSYTRAVEGYKQRMEELGYREGENVIYDVRFVSERDELPRVAREFIENGVDLIHTYSTPATQAAFNETNTSDTPIPIVFGSMGNPLISGTVKDITRPGTNVTGVASLSSDLTAKRLELLQQIRPDTARVALPHSAVQLADVAANTSVEIAQETADRLGIELVRYPVVDREANARVAASILAADVDGIVVGGDSLIWGDLGLYITQAIKEKLPLTVFSVSQTELGALAGVGPDYRVSGRQSADITHKILRGGNPAEIAIQVPERLLFVVNMDTARAIGVTFNSEFLSQVDLIIDSTSEGGR
jgi:putative tryptophan/tyrosine transport system substrate-binding protein